jgi:hypothetical protein
VYKFNNYLRYFSIGKVRIKLDVIVKKNTKIWNFIFIIFTSFLWKQKWNIKLNLKWKKNKILYIYELNKLMRSFLSLIDLSNSYIIIIIESSIKFLPHLFMTYFIIKIYFCFFFLFSTKKQLSHSFQYLFIVLKLKTNSINVRLFNNKLITNKQ